MCTLLNITEIKTKRKFKLTKKMILNIIKNPDSTAKIELKSPTNIIDTVEEYDWVITNYKRLSE